MPSRFFMAKVVFYGKGMLQVYCKLSISQKWQFHLDSRFQSHRIGPKIHIPGFCSASVQHLDSKPPPSSPLVLMFELCFFTGWLFVNYFQHCLKMMMACLVRVCVTVHSQSFSLYLSLSFYLSLSLSFLVSSCLLITLIKCLKGHKCLGSLFGGAL